jgi:preprotein translocase subunit SecD
VLLERPAEARFRFGNADIAKAGFSSDAMGYPAVSFELTASRQGDFGDWTETLLGKGLAIVLDEEILTLATVRSRLPGKGIIQGTPAFSQGEVQALVKLLQQPRLPLPPLGLRVEYLR